MWRFAEVWVCFIYNGGLCSLSYGILYRNDLKWREFVSNRLYICNEFTSICIETACIETTLHRNDREPFAFINRVDNVNFNPWAILKKTFRALVLQLGKELHSPIKLNFTRRRVAVNHIDEIRAGDLVDMQQFSKWSKGYRYLLMVFQMLMSSISVEILHRSCS